MSRRVWHPSAGARRILSPVSFVRFGGAVYSPRTGVILNNELSDFCKRADTIRAGKVAAQEVAVRPVGGLIRSLIVSVGERPPSSMTPVILESESGGLLVIGGSGGSLITSAVALVNPPNSVFAPLLPGLLTLSSARQ